MQSSEHSSLSTALVVDFHLALSVLIHMRLIDGRLPLWSWIGLDNFLSMFSCLWNFLHIKKVQNHIKNTIKKYLTILKEIQNTYCTR